MTTKIKNIVLTCVMAVFFIGLSLFCWLKPADAYSDSERRALDAFPKVNMDTILSGKFMTDFEDYTLDQFPLRDTFRSLKAITEFFVFQKLDSNDIYIEDGYVSKLEYPLKEDMLDYAIDKFQSLYDTYMKDTNVNLYLSVVPDKNYFLAQKDGYLCMDYEKLISTLKENTSYMQYIDIINCLSLEDYYKTDTHWRQEMIVDVAEKLAAGMDTELSAEYREVTLNVPFYGVYYGQSALPLSPDTIKYLVNDTLDNCIVTNYDTGKPVQTSVYDMKKASGKDAYEMFLSGAVSLMTIENPNAKTDKELIIFRDSFGSSIVPLLVDGYAKITLVDIRYMNSNMLGNFIDFEDQDVLFLYSTLVLNSANILR